MYANYSKKSVLTIIYKIVRKRVVKLCAMSVTITKLFGGVSGFKLI